MQSDQSQLFDTLRIWLQKWYTLLSSFFFHWPHFDVVEVSRVSHQLMTQGPLPYSNYLGHIAAHFSHLVSMITYFLNDFFWSHGFGYHQ